MTTQPHPRLSVIMPVRNGGAAFASCLRAATDSLPPGAELIVVNDASTDGSDALAISSGAQVLTLDRQSGPAAARNAGARHASGDVLCFIDADCEVHADTFDQFVRAFESDSDLAAIFGSYDDQPAAKGFFAQYKNLMHHFVHHSARTEASTFWAGCGAIRRDAFVAAGGFDEKRYSRPSIEDIELGLRLRGAGGRIFLEPRIQVSHHKAWTFRSMVSSDIFDRALPWTELIVASGGAMTNDLNLGYASRFSAAAVLALVLFSIATFFYPPAAVGAVVLVALLLWVNRDVYRFFLRKRGLWFALRAVPVHWLYFAYSAAAFGFAGAGSLLRRAARAAHHGIHARPTHQP